MATPKRKTSKSKRDMRRAHWTIAGPNIVECPKCHNAKLAHTVCKKCGYYGGKSILVIEEDNKKKEG